MNWADLHVHSTFCDGSDTMADMAKEAARRGFNLLGFSGHSALSFPCDWCMSPADTAAYRAEAARLKEEYRGKMDLLCGIEQDDLSQASTKGYDYVIGSVHYLKVGEGYLPLDESADRLKEGIDRLFGGDPYLLAERYFARVRALPETTGATVAGHFDLITKFQEQAPLFEEAHPRYRAAAEDALAVLCEQGLLFEVNTGAMARGLRTAPYPAEPLLRSICERGGKVLLTSDCHKKEKLGFRFAQAAALLRRCGFTRRLQPTANGFDWENL